MNFINRPLEIRSFDLLSNGNVLIQYDTEFVDDSAERWAEIFDSQGNSLFCKKIGVYARDDYPYSQAIVKTDSFILEFYPDETDMGIVYQSEYSNTGKTVSAETRRKLSIAFYCENIWPFTLKRQAHCEEDMRTIEVIYQPTDISVQLKIADFSTSAACGNGIDTLYFATEVCGNSLEVFRFRAEEMSSTISIYPGDKTLLWKKEKKESGINGAFFHKGLYLNTFAYQDVSNCAYSLVHINPELSETIEVNDYQLPRPSAICFMGMWNEEVILADGFNSSDQNIQVYHLDQSAGQCRPLEIGARIISVTQEQTERSIVILTYDVSQGMYKLFEFSQ